MKQEFIEIGYGDVLGTARKLHSEGYRMVQICGVTGQGETELIYTFDKDHEMVCYRTVVPFGGTVDDYVRCLADIEKSLRAMFSEK